MAARKQVGPRRGASRAGSKRRARSKRSAQARSGPTPGDVEPRNGFRLKDDEVERALTSGEYRGMLVDYFGEAEYEELTQLARRAQARSTRGGPRVLILPGIMGSKLGRKRALFDDVIWLDPVDIVTGQLATLRLPDRGRNTPLGVLLLAYLRLKLRLWTSGFDASFHPFDWRQDIATQGKALAARIRAEPASEVHLVAHSMGGLVARAALNDAQAAAKTGRLIMLGTPNFGSFAPIEALRGSYPLVHRLAGLDLSASPLDLARKIFSTFPGLHQMVPSPKLFSEVDLFANPAFWAGTGGNPSILAKVPAFQDSLSPARPGKTFLIAGINRETTVGMRVDADGIVYDRSEAGDGTVPLALAKLPGATTYYIDEEHGALPNNGRVESTVVDLLRTGETSRLPTRWDRRRLAIQRVREEHLRTRLAEQQRPRSVLGSEDYRNVFTGLASPRAAAALDTVGLAALPSGETLPGGYQHAFQDVVVSRRRQHAIEIELALGSITSARSNSLVLGVFQGVDPAGPAGAVDEALDGAILEMVERRMFSADAGQVFVLPAGRTCLYADSVLFAGLGGVDAFKDSVQEFVAENVVRTFVRSHVDEFATVLMGVSAGMSVEDSLQHQLRGYIRGLTDADDEHRLRRITLCERDKARYLAIKQELHRLTSTSLFEDVRVTLTERQLPEPPTREGLERPRVSVSEKRIYLIATYEERPAVPMNERTMLPDTTRERDPKRILRVALLTAGGKATVFRDSSAFKKSQLDALLERLSPGNVTEANVKYVGEHLGPLVLGERIAHTLEEVIDDHQLVIVHDTAAGRIPWETLRFNGTAPAVEHGLSRRYAADNLSITKWLEERRHRDMLEVLLVINPTSDLDGAKKEGETLERAVRDNDAIRLTTLREGEATRERLLLEFSSGKYDAIHYAGHAFFDSFQPSRSGLVCAGHQVLSGAHLAGLSQLPALVFFNACESGRVRRPEPPGARLAHSLGLAEAFLRGGVANYVGTYWPVGDASAKLFARELYGSLLQGVSVGDALRGARRTLRDAGHHDWADYIHYGSHDFVLKRPHGTR